jgi:hypothetical protein
MKLKMHSVDFEECALTFSVPKEIMHTRSFGNVPEGVEVDIGAITGDAALNTAESAQKAHNSAMDTIALAARFIADDPHDFHRRGVMKDFVRWVGQQHQ